ncbi:MAG TPA: hypothetical protein PLG60_05545, partial [Acidimicrobiales bacterium]|nr:hypothetical protein [Acidimicrobiales bacterium]
ELNPDTSVVAYCRGPYCVMAAEAVKQLRAAGLRAHRLAEGPLDWHATRFDLGATAGAKSHSKHSLIDKEVEKKKKGITK